MRLLVLISILFLCILSFNILGQNSKEINDLKYKIQIEEGVNTKVNQLLELASLLEKYNPEEALNYTFEALTLSKGLHYTKGKINSYYQIASIESFRGNYLKAIESINLAIEISASYNDQKGIALGNCKLGNIFLADKQFESARVYYQYALELGQKVKSNVIQGLANDGFARLSSEQNKGYLAQQYFILAKDFIESTSDYESKGFIYQNSGKNEAKLESYEDAIADYQLALKNYEKLDNKEEQAVVCFELGQLYQEIQQPDQAIIFMKNSLGFAQETGMEDLIKKGYQTIANTYEENEQFEQAYEYLKYFSAIKDTKEISELESQLELEMKNKEIALITKEKDFHKEQRDKEKFYIIIGLVVMAIIMGLAIFLFISLRQRDRINSKLIIAKDNANKSRKEKEDFFAYTSHEIRTPLNAVVGMAKLLGETDLSDPQQKYLKTITGSAQNILFLVNDVLDLSKIEQGGIEFESIPFSLHEIIEQIIESLAFKKFEKNVEIKADIHPNVPPVIVGDPIRFNQILLNLADNALKFTEEGSVTITVRVTDQYEGKSRIFFSVEDTGIGIKEEKLQSIFDSYQQEHISTTRQYGGTGLGLAITRLLIEKMGGEIKVKSISGVGSTFYFNLWIEDSPLKSLNELNDSKVNQVEKLQNLNILVVDDNQLNREIFYDLVEDRSNNVLITLAENGQEAIEKLENDDFDLILMDIQMPVLDGYEATRLIRNHSDLSEKKKNIPIIAMTAHVLEGVAQKCLEAGMNDSISKPVNLQTLQQKIKSLVKSGFIIRNVQSKNSDTDIIPETSEAGSRINLDNLKSITGNNPEKVNKYINIFLKNIPKDLNNLINQIEEKDYEQVKKAAHKIKGNLGYMGVTNIMPNIKYLEQLSLEEISQIEIKSNLQVVEKEIILILEELKTLK